MSKRTVRQDHEGVFILTNGTRFRPGDVAGLSHAFKQDRGELRTGDRVNIRPRYGDGFIVIDTPMGQRAWGSEYRLRMDREPGS